MSGTLFQGIRACNNISRDPFPFSSGCQKLSRHAPSEVEMIQLDMSNVGKYNHVYFCVLNKII